MSAHNEFVPSRDKLEAVNRISSLTHGGAEDLGPGSKERKRVLERVATFLDLPVDIARSKPELGQEIVEALGGNWSSECYSAGGTITLVGLDLVLRLASEEAARRGQVAHAGVPDISVDHVGLRHLPQGQSLALEGTVSMEEDKLLDDAEDDRRSLEELIATELAELSQTATTPTEVDSGAEFDADDVTFNDNSWVQYVLRVQDWLRLPAPLDRSAASAQTVEDLFAGIHTNADDPAFVNRNGMVTLTTVGLNQLRDRLERATKFKDIFLEDVQANGSVEAATIVWIEQWEEAVDDEPSGPVVATADVWPIQNFASMAQKGRLNLSPSYQRGDVWPTKDAQTLMESILRGIPLPSVIILKPKGDRAPYEVVDGKQRLTAILRFIGGHPAAIDLVHERDKQFPEHKLREYFETDYPRFKRAWKNATGEQLTATLEREHNFPFRLSTTSAALGGELEPVRGKYFHAIKDQAVRVGGGRVEVGDIFGAVTDYKIPVIVYTDATPRQIHEVFNLYNRQGKHLNAEEIRNALYHELDLMRALAIAAGDGVDLDATDALDGPLVFLAPIKDELRRMVELLDEYKFGDVRYRRTKVLSWLFSIVFVDSVDQDGRPRLLSTAQQINQMLDRVQLNGDPLRRQDTIRAALQVVRAAMEAHSAVAEAWAPKFMDNKQGAKWQELQLIASLVGVTMAAVVLGASTEERLNQRAEALRALSDNTGIKDKGWARPSKTQTIEQWRYIARVGLDILDAMGVDHRDAEAALRRDFGFSCVEALERVRPHDEA